MELPFIHAYQILAAVVAALVFGGILLLMLPYVRKELRAERAAEERAVLSAVWVISSQQPQCTAAQIYRTLHAVRGRENRMPLTEIMAHLRSLVKKGELVSGPNRTEPAIGGPGQRTWYSLPEREGQ